MDSGAIMTIKFDSMFSDYKRYGSILLSLITPEIGVEIFKEMERCEPFQYNKSIYDDDYKRCDFMKELIASAFDKYPTAMAKAKKRYLEEDKSAALVHADWLEQRGHTAAAQDLRNFDKEQ